VGAALSFLFRLVFGSTEKEALAFSLVLLLFWLALHRVFATLAKDTIDSKSNSRYCLLRHCSNFASDVCRGGWVVLGYWYLLLRNRLACDWIDCSLLWTRPSVITTEYSQRQSSLEKVLVFARASIPTYGSDHRKRSTENTCDCIQPYTQNTTKTRHTQQIL